MTLLFLGEIEEARLTALQDAAANVGIEPFGMSLDRVACWPHNRIGWAGPERVPPALEGLVGRLRQAVAAAGFSFDRKPFAAHVTLLRDAVCRPLESGMAPIAWRVSDFVLVRSLLDAGSSNYQVIGRWGVREEACCKRTSGWSCTAAAAIAGRCASKSMRHVTSIRSRATAACAA